MDQEWFQRFANVLAETVQSELSQRDVLMLTSELQGMRGWRSADKNVAGYQTVYQVSMLVEWPQDVETMNDREFRYKYVRKWAREMGIKLARPSVLTTFEMECPRAVELAAVGRSNELLLRCVVDYSVSDDMLALRVDALAQWDD